jgi:uncharacterized membrane protein YuzA (DUF378 family)
MNLLFRIAAILFLVTGTAAGIWGVKESSWAYLTIFGVFSMFATFLYILTHPATQHDH